MWDEFSTQGLLGIHEGTLLAQNDEVLDSGIAPPHRDWISQIENLKVEAYFEQEKQAKRALQQILSQFQGLSADHPPFEEQVEEDWNQKWKESFQGVWISPFWEVRPPWVEPEKPESILIRINPGAGFGTGTHETTQLCLSALASSIWNQEQSLPLEGKKVLDFGSGSGILSVAARKLGAEVLGVEIDPLARENAEENVNLNEIQSGITFQAHLESPPVFDLIFANILKPVLLQFSTELVNRLASNGVLILSGLIEKDLQEVMDTYSGLLEKKGYLRSTPQIFQKGEWYALLWT